MFHHIDKGRLCCNDSISYKDFDLDLIPEENIEKSLEIAEKFGYYKIRNYCDQRLDEALDELDKALLRTNANIDSGANKHIKIINNEDSIKSWDLICFGFNSPKLCFVIYCRNGRKQLYSQES